MRARSRLPAIRMENLPFGGTDLSGGLHETLRDMTLFLNDVFSAP